jgi:hypothetical protein
VVGVIKPIPESSGINRTQTLKTVLECLEKVGPEIAHKVQLVKTVTATGLRPAFSFCPTLQSFAICAMRHMPGFQDNPSLCFLSLRKYVLGCFWAADSNIPMLDRTSKLSFIHMDSLVHLQTRPRGRERLRAILSTSRRLASIR